jgi:hypothetical protein
MSCGGIQDRYAETPVHVNEENGHAESRLIHVATPITIALREPKLLGYNGTTQLDIIIKNPGTSSTYRKRGWSIK